VDGGFMVLRDPDARTPGYRGSSVSLGDHVAGRHRSLGSLAGDDLRRLSAAARRRLAALMLTEPRNRLVAAARGAELWLQLARPQGAVVLRYFRSGLARHFGVGVAARDGQGLAVVVGRRIESYGDVSADEVLTRMLEEWRRRGRPTTEDLDVRVTYRDGAPRTKIGWSQASTVRARR
jgi:hypothetical protein